MPDVSTMTQAQIAAASDADHNVSQTNNFTIRAGTATVLFFRQDAASPNPGRVMAQVNYENGKTASFWIGDIFTAAQRDNIRDALQKIIVHGVDLAK